MEINTAQTIVFVVMAIVAVLGGFVLWKMPSSPVIEFEEETPVPKQKIKTPSPPASSENSDYSIMNQLLGLLGSIVLFIGVFTPIIGAPIIGNMNCFQYAKTEGSIILILATISFILVLL